MSYILDALLKADQERQRHSTPTVHSIHAAQSIQPTPGKPRWRYLLLILLLGSGIAAAGMLFGWNALATIRPATPQAADSSVAPGSNTPLPAEAKVVYLPPSDTLPLSRQSDPELAPAPAAPVPSRKENRVAAASKPAAQTTAAPVPAADATVSRIDNRVFNLRELPEALQKEIGDSVVISGFSSSAEDSERLVIINDRVRRAGDDVVAGMTLESIQADGVILNYKGYRFRSGSF